MMINAPKIVALAMVLVEGWKIWAIAREQDKSRGQMGEGAGEKPYNREMMKRCGVPRPCRPCAHQTRPGWPWHTERRKGADAQVVLLLPGNRGLLLQALLILLRLLDFSFADFVS